jgi:DNA sulfur modification protein DndD
MIREKAEELAVKKSASDKLQEQLIREGTSLTLEDLKDYKSMKEHLGSEVGKIKNRFKDLIEFAPFAIAGNKFQAVKKYLALEEESNSREASEAFLEKKLVTIKKELKKNRKFFALNEAKEGKLLKIITSNLLSGNKRHVKVLLDFSPEQRNRFFAVYDNLTNSYGKSFKELVSDLKKQQSSYNIIIRKLQDAESKENDPVIKTIREDKTKLDVEIRQLESTLIEQQAKKMSLQNEHSNISRQVSELAKKVSVEKIDRAKDEMAERLIGELDEFIFNLKMKKKASLESNILKELNRLMHKSNFINRVDVIIEGGLIDIELYDKQEYLIDKEGLSKGEQQLYATALLRALIHESNIHFPVFIDSPLQKFDKRHAKNIIKDFYPNVSSQVILFPLLEKELNETEYSWLLPKVGCAYLIEHTDEYKSEFVSVSPRNIFSEYQNQEMNAH